jgi:multiple sugar transport system ATP-binding protein
MATIAFERVEKMYRGGVVGVRALDLHIEDGELFCIMGPSGCGKSTTLSLLAGLETPTAGTLRIDGEVVNARSPRERDIAMVFQSYALYPHLSVRKNLAFPLEVARTPRAEAAQRIAETAELLGLNELLERLPRELSGGQRQRVALGRALVRRPRVFLFDEPLSNLDAGLRAQLRRELKSLHRKLKATFVYVTHDQTEAMTLADRVAVMRRGELVQVGSPRELYERPANTFVAELFGTPKMNLLPPEWLGLPAELGPRVGVRPEHLQILPRHAGDERGTARGEVAVVEPVGSETWVTVAIALGQVTVRAPAEVTLQPGEAVFLRPDPARVLRFDAEGRLRP